MKTTSRKPRCKLIGTDGNIYSLIGKASDALRKSGQAEKRNEMHDEIEKATSYDQALQILMKYVEAY